MKDNCDYNKVIQGIECSVSDCVYNCDKNCTAGKIHVGPQNATDVSETDCQTFQSK